MATTVHVHDDDHGARYGHEHEHGRGLWSKVKHVLTHKELSVLVATGQIASRAKAPARVAEPYEKAAFLDPEDTAVGVSTLAKKVLAAAAKG